MIKKMTGMDFLQMYIANPAFTKRYIAPDELFEYLRNVPGVEKRIIGYSAEKLPIYFVTWGKGNINVLAWSQMHGNESNSSLAFLDFLFTVEKHTDNFKFLYHALSLDFILMLNPDGAKRWTRENAENIDLNRDFWANKSTELSYLKSIIEAKKYDYALNLHEQRTIFSTDGEKYPATMSFLSASEDESRAVTETRKKSMAVIAKIVAQLKEDLPNEIGRYTDEFYPNAVGDNFMKLGIPTILFEGGHYYDDYERVHQRKFYTQALYQALIAMVELNGSTENWENYFDIPENKASHYDMIFRNVNIRPSANEIIDIGIQYAEEYDEELNDIVYIPIISSLEEKEKRKGWVEIDCMNKKFISFGTGLEVGDVKNFTIE